MNLAFIIPSYAAVVILRQFFICFFISLLAYQELLFHFPLKMYVHASDDKTDRQRDKRMDTQHCNQSLIIESSISFELTALCKSHDLENLFVAYHRVFFTWCWLFNNELLLNAINNTFSEWKQHMNCLHMF